MFCTWDTVFILLFFCLRFRLRYTELTENLPPSYYVLSFFVPFYLIFISFFVYFTFPNPIINPNPDPNPNPNPLQTVGYGDMKIKHHSTRSETRLFFIFS